MCSQLVSLLASGQVGLLQSLKTPRFATHLRRHFPLANQLAEPSDQIESKLHIGRIPDRSLQDAELPHNSGGVVLLRILPMEVLRVVETGYGGLSWFESPPGGLTGKIVLDRIVGAKAHVVVDVGNAGIIEDLLGRGNSRLEVALDERRLSWRRTLRHAAPPRGSQWLARRLGGSLLDQSTEKVAGGGRAPVARALDAAHQPALAIDQVRRGRTPDAVDSACHVTGGVQEDGRGVPALLRRLLHE